MSIQFIFAVVIAVTLTADENREKEVSEELRQLTGTWIFTSLEIDGNALPETAFAGSKIIVDGDSSNSAARTHQAPNISTSFGWRTPSAAKPGARAFQILRALALR